jgi:hypothetical protein
MNACAQLRDQWTWTGSAWSRIQGDLPFDASDSLMANDPATTQTVLFGGGDTWLWDGANWNKGATNGPTQANKFPCSDRPPEVIGLYFAASMRRLLLLGESMNSDPVVYEVWSWDGVAWVRIWPGPSQPSSSGPPRRLVPASAWDPVSNRLILFGGVRPMGGLPPNDTWAWDGTNWTQLAPQTVPPPIDGGQLMAIDPTTGKILMLDGVQTWTWDGSDWRLLASSLPAALDVGASVLVADPAHSQVIYFGGCTLGCTQPFVGTLVWDGTSWSLH